MLAEHPRAVGNLDGGVGPFSFQWYEDGAPISGANGPTFQPTDGGTHAYNVQVKADTCPDFVADGPSTTLIVESAPRFNGVVSATDQRASTCGIDLAWNAATTVCPGPLSYVVCRAQGGAVSADPGNYLTTLPGGSTGYSGTAGLVDHLDYSYLVQAVDASTMQSDGNAAAATSPATGPDVVSFFDDGGDTVSSQLTPAGNWILGTAGGHDAPGVYAIASYVGNDCSEIVSDPISIGSGGTLSFWSSSNIESSHDKGVADISTDGGASWARVDVNYPGTSTHTTDACGIGAVPAFTGDHTGWAEYSADLAPWAGQSAILRFEFGTDGAGTESSWGTDSAGVSPCRDKCRELPHAGRTPHVRSRTRMRAHFPY